MIYDVVSWSCALAALGVAGGWFWRHSRVRMNLEIKTKYEK